MNHISKSIFKHLITPSYKFSSTGFAGFTDRVYQKVNITRLPN